MSEHIHLRALILGAAAGGGLPQWNCGCANCVAARVPDSILRPQTQSSLAVSSDGRNWALLNASPDIRQQIEANRQLHPRTLRHSPIRSVLVTNGDIDHIAGLLVLRERQPFDLFGTAALAEIIEANPIFRALDKDCVPRRTIGLNTAFKLIEGIEATLFPVPGKVPLFMEGDRPDLGLVGEQTVGVELRAGGRRVCYIPGCGKMTDQLINRIRGCDLLFFDGTVFRDDEMITTGTGQKTGCRMGHIAIDGADGSLQALADLDVSRTIYVHLNNTNPIWRCGPERAKVEAAGLEIGHDGMEVVL